LDNARIHRLIFDTSTEERLRFLGYALSERLYVLNEYYTAFFTISAKDLERFHSQTGDTEGLVNYALSMEGIVLAILLIEREDGVKLSFRSKGEFSVSEFARRHFNGGGHRNAGGGTSDVGFSETVKKLMDILPTYKEQLLENYRKEKFVC
jgi:phosphoesterase RecJ-like protein